MDYLLILFCSFTFQNCHHANCFYKEVLSFTNASSALLNSDELGQEAQEPCVSTAPTYPAAGVFSCCGPLACRVFF